MSKTEGFFSVPRAAIYALADNGASSKVIAGYLVLARFTDKSGIYSTAGKNALCDYLGIANGAAEAILNTLQVTKIEHNGDSDSDDELQSKRLILTPNEWAGEYQGKNKCTWIVNDFDTSSPDRVWIPNSLVSGSDNFSAPLKRLIKIRNDAVMRALALLYCEQDEEQVGGAKSSATLFVPYSIVKTVSKDDLILSAVEATGTVVIDAKFAERVLFTLAPDEKGVRRAIERLESEGFIYRAVTVFDNSPSLPETEAMYTLDTKATCGSTIQDNDDSLATEMQKYASAHGIKCADSAGRFYRKYAAVAPSGDPIHVAEIIRLRLRITAGPDFINERLKRMADKHQEARGWLTTADDNERNEQPEPATTLNQPQSSVSYGSSQDNGWECDITFDDPPLTRGNLSERIAAILSPTEPANLKKPGNGTIPIDETDDIWF